MLQQINLYQPAVRKKQKPFSLLMTLLCAVAMSAALGVIYSTERDKQQEVQGRLDKIMVEEEERLARIEKLAAGSSPVVKSKQLEQKIDLLKAKRAQKLAVLVKLQDNVSNTAGFSAYFEGLARQRIADLWLTKIRINNGGERLDIDGSALGGEFVPKYLRRLSAEAVYSGREFHTFALTRPEGKSQFVDFSISTAAGKEE